MLITTEARVKDASHIKDMGETLLRLNAAQKQHVALAKLAQQCGAEDAEGKSKAAAVKAQHGDRRGLSIARRPV